MDLLKEQLKLEEESVAIGVKKYREGLEKGDSNNFVLHGLVKKTIEPVIAELKEEKKRKKGGRTRKEYLEFISNFEELDLAYIISKFILTNLEGRRTLTNLSIRLVKELIAHLNYTNFASNEKKYLRAINKNIAKRNLPDIRKKAILLKTMKERGYNSKPDVDKAKIGTMLIAAYIKATGIVEQVKNEKGSYIIVATDAAKEFFERNHARAEVMQPFHFPMVIEPRDWTNFYDGGYLNNHKSLRYQLVKTRNKKHIEMLQEVDLSQVYGALNSLQKTAWTINKKVYDVVKAGLEENKGRGGLPISSESSKPDFLEKQWKNKEELAELRNTPEGDELFRKWKQDNDNILIQFNTNRSKLYSLMYTMLNADRMLNFEKFYFCYNLDWRGRIYPIQPHLNPQGDDVKKALLMFADGKPLGVRGAWWLQVHIANTWGNDKVSFNERVAWVNDNRETLLSYASDPFINRGWEDADKPFSFLAACFEYEGYVREGEAYVSHIAIAMDGSCNGLQNFSALLKDSVGGKAVNLIPSDKPQDVYSEVLEAARKEIDRLASQGDKYARIWQGKLDRKMVKRPVMTVPYGVSKVGMKDQILDELKHRSADFLTTDDEYKSAFFLANILWDCIGQVVIAARDAMDWLQDVAKATNELDAGIKWTTPIGYVCYQHYFIEDMKRVQTMIDNVKVTLAVNETTERLNKRKQVNSISPNYIHSMDASHLMLTINAASQSSIKDFAVIHDSYGTLAADTDTLAHILREQFVNLYKVNNLQLLNNQLLENLETIELPELPVQGNLDINSVKDSLYFFA